MIFDETSLIGIVIFSLTSNVTGSMFLTLLMITMIFIAIASYFSMPLELTIPLILPFFITAVVMTSEIMPVFGAVLIYLAILFTRRFWLN